MNERQKMILRLSLSYALSNLDDVCDCFQCDALADQLEGSINYNGEIMAEPEEAEIEQLMKELQ